MSLVMFLLWILCLIFTIMLILKVYLKLTCGMCKSRVHLVGKVAIVTGANTGIGYETARDFAERGARVILACRSDVRGQEARDRIAAATNNAHVVYKKLDLASLASVRAFAMDVLENEKRLDILVNNAGAAGLGNRVTEDGLQLGMQVNYFGPFLLTRLLEPLLRRSAPSRIVNVSSIGHRHGEVDFTNLNMEKRWTSFKEYANSKLCNVLMTVEMSRQLEGSGVVTNSLHPGAVATEVNRNCNAFIRFTIEHVMKHLFKSAREGAQTSIYLAVAPEVSNVTGKYFSDCREAKPAPAAHDANLARKLWEVTERLVQLTSTKDVLI